MSTQETLRHIIRETEAVLQLDEVRANEATLRRDRTKTELAGLKLALHRVIQLEHKGDLL